MRSSRRRDSRSTPPPKPKPAPAKPPSKPPSAATSKPEPTDRRKRGPEALGGKWIDFQARTWVLAEKDDILIEATSLRMSKDGLYLRSLIPLPIGTQVLALLKDKPRLTADYIRANKHVLRGRVTDVEQEPMMCKLTIQITLGRVDPESTLKIIDDTKFWWTRSWQ